MIIYIKVSMDGESESGGPSPKDASFNSREYGEKGQGPITGIKKGEVAEAQKAAESGAALPGEGQPAMIISKEKMDAAREKRVQDEKTAGVKTLRGGDLTAEEMRKYIETHSKK